MRSFNERDECLADEVRQRDRDTDAIYDDLFHAIGVHIQAGSPDVPADIQAIFVGKSLERIGDHATNIAEEAPFLARGDLPSATRRGLVMTADVESCGGELRISQSLVCYGSRYLWHGDIKVNLDAFRAVRAGRDLELGPTEYHVLCHLLRDPCRVLSREELIACVFR